MNIISCSFLFQLKIEAAFLMLHKMYTTLFVRDLSWKIVEMKAFLAVLRSRS